MRRSRSGQREKVQQARGVVDEALGDAARRDVPEARPHYMPVTRPAEPVQVRSEAIGVLTIGEAATRLDISRAEVERMIASGRMRSLVAGFTTVVPTSEVERLQSPA